MSKLQRDQAGQLYPAIIGKHGTTQVVTANATSAQSTAFGAETTLVRIATSNYTGAGAHLHYEVGANPTASTTTSPLLPCGLIEYVVVAPGEKIALIRGGGTNIDVSITEITNA